MLQFHWCHLRFTVCTRTNTDTQRHTQTHTHTHTQTHTDRHRQTDTDTDTLTHDTHTDRQAIARHREKGTPKLVLWQGQVSVGKIAVTL